METNEIKTNKAELENDKKVFNELIDMTVELIKKEYEDLKYGIANFDTIDDEYKKRVMEYLFSGYRK